MVRTAGNSGCSADTSTPGSPPRWICPHHHPLPRPGKPQLIPDIASQCPIGPDTPFLNRARFFSTVSASGSTSSALVEYASHHVQHMHKALTQMNVKLQHVIRDITGQTGMAIIEAIVSGERDPWQLAQLRDHRIKADQETIARSLQGHWLEERIFELSQALELYRTYHAKIDECDRKIEAQLERFNDVTDGGTPAGNGRRRSQGNAPSFDIRTHLYRMTGVDLTRIDGIDGFTALKVVSEIGTDMTKWESAKHFASWLGLSPDNRITDGKVISSRTKPNANRAATALRLAAYGLHRSNSALGGLPAPEESTPGSAQGHHRHGAQAGETHLLHAALRAGLRRCRRRILREPVSATGVARCNAPGQRRAYQLGYQLVPMSDAPGHIPGVPLNPAAVA